MEDLLDQLVAKKSTAEYGTDNISAILIKFAKFKNYLSIFLLQLFTIDSSIYLGNFINTNNNITKYFFGTYIIAYHK